MSKDKEYVRTVKSNWWLAKRSYTLFMVRELTAVFVGAYAILLIIMLLRASQGPAEFAGFCEWLSSPLSIALHVVIFLMALYHTITFFNLSGVVTRIYRGEERVPAPAIVVPNYVAWVVVSAIVAWITLHVAGS